MPFGKNSFLTPGDMDAHDSLVIQLDFESNWSGRFFFIEPAEGYSIVEVAQRHENILTFPGDGTTCSLENWNRYASTWKDLHCTEHFFQTVSLNANEKGQFHAFEQGELLAAFDKRGKCLDCRPQSLFPLGGGGLHCASRAI